MMFFDCVSLSLMSSSEEWRVPAHDIKNRGLPNTRDLALRQHDGRVSGHQEMASRGWDEGGDEANEVIVHVARVAESGC
jgi:hypothetical protein